MRLYTTFKYIWPPRPEVVAPAEHIETLDKGTHIAQPKFNGSCAILATNGKDLFFMNRHKQNFKHKLLIDNKELLSLHRGKGWIYLVGEYMNKSQRGPDGKIFNGKFVIFDILVYNNEWLIDTNIEGREKLLHTIYETTEAGALNEWMTKISTNCFVSRSFGENFDKIWNSACNVGMLEGLVFKRKNGALTMGLSEKNNTGWQCKIRKPTLNYLY